MYTTAILAAFAGVMSVLTVNTVTQDLLAQYTEKDIECAEMRGGIKSISSFLDGVIQGLSGTVAPTDVQRVLNALTDAMFELQREYDMNCN